MEHWAKFFFWKKMPQNMFKTRLDTFGNDFRLFWNFETFWFFFENFRKLDPPWETGQKFFRKNCSKTRSKHVCILLGTLLAIFGILKIFWFFLKVFEDSTLHGTLRLSSFQKVAPKHVQNTFVYFWERFWAYLDFWDFFDCSQSLEDSTLHGKLGKSFPKNLPQNMFKTRLDTFWNDFRHFWNFENIFFEKFRKLDPPWSTGHKIISKKSPQSIFGHFWERFRANSEFWVFFRFFSRFRSLEPPWNTGQNFFFEKITSKHVQNKFGHFWERFRANSEYWDFFRFF